MSVAKRIAGLVSSFDRLVHGTASRDETIRARHASFIAAHVLGGLLASLVFAAYFAWTGLFGVAALLACLLFLAPIGIAALLSLTGRLEVAHLLSAANLTALVTLAALLSGGSRSFAIAWLILVPLEAALSADRRMMFWSAGLAASALVGVHIATEAGLVAAAASLPVDGASIAFVSNLGGVAYAAALAASVQQIHRRSEKQITESRESYRLIAENANDLITRHAGDGRVLFASHASRSLLGLAPEAVVAHGLAPAIGAGDRTRLEHALASCLADDQAVTEEFEIERTDADGAVRRHWIEMRGQPVLSAVDGPGGLPVRSVVAVTRDVTARKAEAAEIAAARDEAERASRAKTAFLATMSHELRTPLSAIIGFAELLHRELLLKAREPKHAEYCRVIHQSGEHLLSLVQDLLDVSRIESGKFTVQAEPFALADVAASAVETLRPQADGKGLILANATAPDLPDVLGDRRATKQVLLNLVSNACKFTPEGGRITLSARRAGVVVEVEVRDSGIGIAPEHLERITQPFYQVETSYARRNEGAGLGLSIARGLVELQGGTFRAESRIGEGSVFTITLPVDEHEAASDDGSEAATTSAPRGAVVPHPKSLAHHAGEPSRLLARAV